MKFLLLTLLFPIVSASEGVHVGNGGGEAEMRILQMVPAVSSWAKACNDNPGACGAGISFDFADFQGLRRKIGFAPAKSNTQWCAREQTTIPHEALYSNNIVPKPDNELAVQLLGRLLSCAGWEKNKLGSIRMEFLPLAKRVTSLPLFVLPGKSSDVMVTEASNVNAQRLLLASLKCSSYRYISSEGEYFKVRCSNGYQYLVQPRYTGSVLQFQSRYDGAE